MSGPIQGDQIDHWPNCPNAPKPAVCPACRFHPTAEPPSEPPIDHRFEAMYAAWKAEQAISIALRAELDALKAEVENVRQYARIEITDLRAVRGGLEMRLQTELAENAALKARMEELSESLLWATSSYEERVVILANREKRKEQAKRPTSVVRAGVPNLHINQCYRRERLRLRQEGA